ncbi:7664_t:CDS:2 [Gigaspora rosea]|nr:7664_t:CDS:2 [Gigaspora rosea]
MSNDQLTINTLRELNARLASEITELRKENAEIPELRKKLSEVEVENIELKAENVKLNKLWKNMNPDLVAKLEQKQSQTNENFIVKSDDDAKGIDQSSVNTMKNSNDTPASNISDNTSNSDDVSNFDICQESENQYLTSPILIGPKSSEDMEIDDFLDSTYKEKVSKEIIQSIREKKLRVQEKIITSQDTKQESNIIQNHTIGISETGGPGKSNIDEASQYLAQLCNKVLMLRMVQVELTRRNLMLVHLWKGFQGSVQ